LGAQALGEPKEAVLAELHGKLAKQTMANTTTAAMNNTTSNARMPRNRATPKASPVKIVVAVPAAASSLIPLSTPRSPGAASRGAGYGRPPGAAAGAVCADAPRGGATMACAEAAVLRQKSRRPTHAMRARVTAIGRATTA